MDLGQLTDLTVLFLQKRGDLLTRDYQRRIKATLAHQSTGAYISSAPTLPTRYRPFLSPIWLMGRLHLVRPTLKVQQILAELVRLLHYSEALPSFYCHFFSLRHLKSRARSYLIMRGNLQVSHIHIRPRRRNTTTWVFRSLGRGKYRE